MQATMRCLERQVLQQLDLVGFGMVVIANMPTAILTVISSELILVTNLDWCCVPFCRQRCHLKLQIDRYGLKTGCCLQVMLASWAGLVSFSL